MFWTAKVIPDQISIQNNKQVQIEAQMIIEMALNKEMVFRKIEKGNNLREFWMHY